MKKTLMCFLVFLSSMLLFSCKRAVKYYGEYDDLYTVACNSIITIGFFENDQVSSGADIFIVEEDNYGRKMFVYADNDSFYSRGTKKRMFVLISQYLENQFVYYYPNYNFVAYKGEIDRYSLDWEIVENYFNKIPEIDIQNLKRWNDWNKPIDSKKCIKSLIKNHYDDEYREFDNNYNTFSGNYGTKTAGYVVSIDSYGNKLICFRDEKKSYISVVSKNFENILDIKLLFMDKERNYYLPFSDNYDYQKKLKELKETCYWNVKDLDEM